MDASVVTGGFVGVDSRDGSPSVVVSGLGCPGSIALDATFVYWTDRTNGTVAKVEKAGGTPVVLVDAQRSPGDLALDSHHVYWVDVDARTVMRIPLGGGPPQTIATEQVNPGSLVVEGDTVYWTNGGTYWDEGNIMKADVTGGRPVTLVLGDRSPHGIALDGQAMYWGTLDGIRRMGRGLGEWPTTVTNLTGGNKGVVVDAGRIYWIHSAAYVLALDLAGSPQIQTIATSARWKQPDALALDAAAVYWSESGSVIRKAARPHGTPVTIATQAESGPGDIAIDETDVFWSNCTAGTIMKVSK